MRVLPAATSTATTGGTTAKAIATTMATASKTAAAEATTKTTATATIENYAFKLLCCAWANITTATSWVEEDEDDSAHNKKEE